MHHAFVVDTAGEKMSKSLGNFTDLIDLIATVDPRAYRVLVLQAHYRSPLRVDADTIGVAERSLAGLDGLARRVADLPVEEAGGVRRACWTASRPAWTTTSTRRARWPRCSTRCGGPTPLLDAGDQDEALALAAGVFAACRAVGLMLHADDDELPPDVVARADQRDAARAQRDWATADAIRAELEADGWVVEDTPRGTRVRPG